MEMALNIGAFDDISLQDLMEINGGVNWWNLGGGVLAVASGVVWFCGGPGKVAAGCAIGAGVCTIIGAFK